MPLLIPNRPPNPFFSQQRKRILPDIIEEQAPDSPDGLKLFPLEPRKEPSKHQRRQAPDYPGYKMAPPMVPQTRNTVGQTMPPQQPMTPQPPQNTPPSPEQAVQQFRRVNKGLPDGVRYEPLDETTMQLLRDNGHLPKEQPQVSTPAMPALPPVPPVFSGEEQEQTVKTIQRLIQDERNAHVFYSHLEGFADIAKSCLTHMKQLKEMLASQYGNEFAPAETEINTQLEFGDAVALALVEEEKSLRVLTELLDEVKNAECERVIQRVINRKIVNYNQLARMT